MTMTVSNKIRISWSGIDTNIVKQEVFYSKDGGNFQLLETINSGSQNYLVVDTTKFPNGEYKFQVKLTDSVGNIFNTTTDSYTFANTTTSATTIQTTPSQVTSQSITTRTNTSVTTSGQSLSSSVSSENTAISTDTSNTNAEISSASMNSEVSTSASTTSVQNQFISIQDNYIYIGDKKLPQALGIALSVICCLSLLIIVLPWVFFFISERKNKVVVREKKI